jgi:hypothetical protein
VKEGDDRSGSDPVLWAASTLVTVTLATPVAMTTDIQRESNHCNSATMLPAQEMQEDNKTVTPLEYNTRACRRVVGMSFTQNKIKNNSVVRHQRCH